MRRVMEWGAHHNHQEFDEWRDKSPMQRVQQYHTNDPQLYKYSTHIYPYIYCLLYTKSYSICMSGSRGVVGAVCLATPTQTSRFLDRPYKSICKSIFVNQFPAIMKKEENSIFLSEEVPTGSHTPTLWLQHFFTIFAHFASVEIRPRNFSLARKLLYHCTSRILVPHKLYKTEHKLIVWGPKLIQIKKLSTTKFYNFSRSTTFILVVSPSDVTYKIWISNLRKSNVVFHDKMISNEKVINYKVS